MSLDEGSLETAANGGLLDFAKWPSMVEPLVERLEHIVYNVFPMPQVPSESSSTAFAQHLQSSDPSYPHPNTVPSSSNKENATPGDPQTPPRPSASSNMQTPASASTERVPDSQPQSQSFTAGQSNDSLPEPLLLLLNSIRSSLRSMFASKPPHTIQRLAELVLRPNDHYRTLPAWLRAVDRVVCVTSCADEFPLQMQASAANQVNGIVNGSSGTTASSFMFTDHAPGSDESLGGALLTPIPWLNGVSSPSAESHGVGHNEGDVVIGMEGATTATTEDHETFQPTQPHPQEETMATTDIQPETESAQTATSTSTATPSHPQTSSVIENQAMEGTGSPPPTDASEDVPHARGPPVVGVEDMGLQDGRGVEMTLSNENEAAEDGKEGEGESGSPNPAIKEKEAGTADGDGDIELEDPTSNGGGEGGGESGEAANK